MDYYTVEAHQDMTSFIDFRIFGLLSAEKLVGQSLWMMGTCVVVDEAFEWAEGIAGRKMRRTRGVRGKGTAT